MNLNNQPTIDELAEMFAAQKDTLDDHILWIGKSGEVQIDCLAPHTEEAEFDRNNRELAARLKMYRRGQGYVGKKLLPIATLSSKCSTHLTMPGSPSRTTRKLK